MIYKFKTHCPVCHHQLIEQTNAANGTASYMCKFKPRHYYYLDLYHDQEEEQFVRFIIPNYEITYIIDLNEFIIYSHDGKMIQAFVTRVPRIDFDWKDLPALSNRIKKLVPFS